MENESQGIMLFVIIAIMTTTIIGVIVGFAIVIKNVNSKIQTNQEMISAAVVQDEINLKQLGLKLSADLNKELGDASTRTIKSLQQISTQVDSVNDKATSSAAKIQSNVDSLTSGKTAFQSLAVGPAQLTRDANGNLDFNTGPIFTVTSSNLILALKNSASSNASSSNASYSNSNPNPPHYKISQDANNNINLGGPGQLIAPPAGIGYLGGAWGVHKTPTGPLRMYAPASDTSSYIGLGFSQQTPNTYADTLQIQSKAAANAPRDRVTIVGDLVVSGNVQNTTLQEQITALTAANATQQEQLARAQTKANLAYNAAMSILQEQKQA